MVEITKISTLLEQYQKDNPEDFPKSGTEDYHRKFKNIEEYLNNEVHPEVLAGSILNDAESGYLTDHGPEHIKMVQKRACKLILRDDNTCILTPYEVFLLGVAVHIHDVGNIYGRAGHEQKYDEIMATIEQKASLGQTESRMIKRIARAHGGKTSSGSKDTISELPSTDHILSKPIRPRKVASILRFADELAEDNTRASRFRIDKKMVPEKSEVFHHHANSLESVMIDREGGIIDLKFYIKKDIACKLLGKGDKKVYLIDEIYERTLKTHLEAIYCMRFVRPDLDIGSVNVKIIITSDDGLSELQEIAFKLEEVGYPSSPQGGIESLCDTLKEKTGNKIKELLLKDNKKEDAA